MTEKRPSSGKGNRIEVNPGEFRERVWKTFDVPYVLQTLLDERPSYYGHKRILLEAFLSWLMAPHLKLHHQTIILTTLKLLSPPVSKGRPPAKLFDQPDRIAEKSGGEIFLTEICDTCLTMANMRAFTGSTAILDKKLGFARDLETSKAVISIFHYVTENQEAYKGSISINMAASVLKKVYDNHARVKTPKSHTGHSFYAERSAKSSWNDYQPSAALIYSSVFIEIDPGVTLFEMLIAQKKIPPTRIISILPQWLGYAKYISTSVMTSSHLEGAAESSLKILPRSISPIPFQTNELHSDLREALDTISVLNDNN